MNLNNPPIRLLLIDDDHVDRLACRRALEQSGLNISIDEADSAERGLELARSEPFDAIVLDHYLPGRDGLEWLAELAEQGREPPAPVVMLTCANDATMAVRALRLGASDYLVKDASRESLAWLPAVILRVLRERATHEEKRRTLEELRAAEAKYRSLVEQIPAITYIASIERPGQLIYISPQTQQLGYAPESWLAAPEGVLAFVHPDDRDNVITHLSETYEHHTPLRCEYRMRQRDGRIRWMLDEANVVVGEEGRALFLQGILVDITQDKENERELDYYRHRLEELVAQRTAQLEKQSELLRLANQHMDQDLCERKRVEAALRASEARCWSLLEAAGEGIIGLDGAGRCTYANPAALALLGEQAGGWNFLERLARRGTETPNDHCPLARSLGEGMPGRFTTSLARPDGRSLIVECGLHPLRPGQGEAGAVVVMRDVSEAQALTRRLSYEASHDPLTGLYNRMEFERRLAKLLAEARIEASEHALCFLDLDRFKAVNDTCGHAAGDHLLRALGALMEGHLRQSDILARLGGDEFGLLLEHCPLEQAWVIANELREAAHAFRFSWGGEEFSVGMSVGVVALNAHSGDAAAMLSAADKACYIAKRRGRDRVHLLDSPGADRLHDAFAAQRWSQAIPCESEPTRPALFPVAARTDSARVNL